MVKLLRKHCHVIIVVTLLTLVMTYPTIVYVLETDVFWHAGGKARDIYLELWEIWYGNLLLTGQADLFYTDLMFYPDGLSLGFHPFSIPNILVGNILNVFLPLANAYNLTYLLIIFSSTLSAYIYLLWLFKDRWIALFGAAVFGFSPIVVSTMLARVAFLAPVPLLLYCFHRGAKENRRWLVLLAGILTGLITMINLYQFICALILLGFFLCGMAVSRWRDKSFWLSALLLILSVSVSSLWRIYPMLNDIESLDAAVAWHGANETDTDLVSYFVNHSNPFVGRLVTSSFEIKRGQHSSGYVFLGYLPLLLICAGLLAHATRRKTLPWVIICAFFLILRLGSHLIINGTAYPDIHLLKHYLVQIAPSVFQSFRYGHLFMIGALLPFAVLTCYGLVALQKRLTIASKPMFILALVLIVAIEYYIPARGYVVPDEQLAYLDWLKQNEGGKDEIRLINLPMGRTNAKRHGLHQALSDFPHVEGAISRTPARAYDYIRANYLLDNWAWHNQRPVHCDMPERDAYIAGLSQLERDGFSHVVYHQHEGYYFWTEIKESFHGVEPSYSNGVVSIYTINDLRDSCPSELSAEHLFTRSYANALQLPSFLDERHGAIVVLPPTAEAGDHFKRYLRHFAEVDRTIVTITWDELAVIEIHDSEFADPDADINPEHLAALWLVNDPLMLNYQETKAYQQWLKKRFTFCQRLYEEERSTIDLYLRMDIPCTAMAESSAIEVRYDSGLRLHNASYNVHADKARFYLAWTNNTENIYGFTIQFFDDTGRKALQFDNVIFRQLLSDHEIDTTSLMEGTYTIKLIVYDFETKKSQGGTLTDTGERFERELQIMSIKISR